MCFTLRERNCHPSACSYGNGNELGDLLEYWKIDLLVKTLLLHVAINLSAWLGIGSDRATICHVRLPEEVSEA